MKRLRLFVDTSPEVVVVESVAKISLEALAATVFIAWKTVSLYQFVVARDFGRIHKYRQHRPSPSVDSSQSAPYPLRISVHEQFSFAT